VGENWRSQNFSRIKDFWWKFEKNRKIYRKIQNWKSGHPQLTSFQLQYWSVLETLPCLWNFRIYLGRKWIFQQFLSSKPPWPMKLAPPNCRCIIRRWQISCRYVYIFRKLNSINLINHNFSFCGAWNEHLTGMLQLNVTTIVWNFDKCCVLFFWRWFTCQEILNGYLGGTLETLTSQIGCMD
jgi:hypothetical protein